MVESTTVSLLGVRATLAVLDEGSISQAAATLFVSQPALSRLVRITEKRLELALFERRSNGVAPLPQGGPVFDRFRRIRRHFEQAEAELAALPRFNGACAPLFRRLALRHLRAVVSVFDHGSATAAAESLGHSTSAVARAIRDAESLLKAPLFQRQPSQLVPTRAGRLLTRHAKLVLHELRYVHEDMHMRSGAVVGRIAIGSTPLPRTFLVPEALGRLARQHQNLVFSIVEGPYHTLLDGLRCGDLDMLVGALRGPAPAKNVHEEALFRAPLSIVVRRDHPLTRQPDVTLEDLARATWVLPRKGTPTRGHFERLFREAGMASPRWIVECSSLVATRALLLRNDWVSMVSKLQIHYEEQFGILTALPIKLPTTIRPIGITVRADTAPPPGVHALVETLREVSDEIARISGSGIEPPADLLQ